MKNNSLPKLNLQKYLNRRDQLDQQKPHSVSILVMHLIIEYINVLTDGTAASCF